MEDFTLVRSDEGTQVSQLQAEWLESRVPKQGLAAKVELALVLTGKDKQDGPGKDVADRLDRELKEFATAKLDNPSANMQSFQNMIDKFCSNPDKNKAMEELGDSYSRLNVQMGKEAEATYNEIQEEAAKQPGRKALDAEYYDKLNKFFDKVDAMPLEQGWKVLELMEWQEGETKVEHQNRVREGLKDNKDLLAAYDAMENASDKVDASKSAKERELEALHRQQINDFQSMKPVVEKAYIRSTIEY